MLKTTIPNNLPSTNSASTPPDQSSEFAASNRSSTQPASFEKLQDGDFNQRYSQPGQPSSPQQGREYDLSGKISLNPVKSPTASQFSGALIDRSSDQGVSGEAAPSYHDLPAEPQATPSDGLNNRHTLQLSNRPGVLAVDMCVQEMPSLQLARWSAENPGGSQAVHLRFLT